MQNSTYIGKHLEYKQYFCELIEKNPKNTVLVTSHDPSISNETLFCVGRWLVGCRVKYDMDKSQPVLNDCKEEYLKEDWIQIGEKYLQIIETNEGRLITFNMKNWREIRVQSAKSLDKFDNQKYIQQALLLKCIVNSLNKCTEEKKSYCKLYGVVEQPKSELIAKKFEQYISELAEYIKAPSSQIIKINYTGNEECMDENIRIKRSQWQNGCPLRRTTIFANRQPTQPIELKTYQYIEEEERQKKGIVQNYLTKPCIELEQRLSEFICVFFNILKEEKMTQSSFDRSIFQERKNSQLNEKIVNKQYQEFLRNHEIDNIIKEAPELPSYFTSIKHKYEPDWESDSFENIPEFRQIHLFTEFKMMFKYLLEHKNLQELKFFFANLCCLMSDVLGADNPQYPILHHCKVYLQLLVDEIIVVRQLSGGDWAIKTVKSYVDRLVPKGNKFYESILNVKVKKDQQIQYYKSFSYILEKNFDEASFKQNQIDEVKKKKLERQIEIKMEKAAAIQRKFLGKNDKKIATAISDIFYVYEQRSKMSEVELPVSSLQILLRCAKMLRTISKPDLAFTVYKKVKQVYKAEQCLEEMCLELSEKAKAQEYLNFAKYLQKVGFKEMGMKYSQLSYELDESQLQSVVKNKIKYMHEKNEESTQELKLLQEIEAKSKKQEEYCSGADFDEEFRERMRKLQEEVNPEQNRLKVVFKRGKISDKLSILRK